MQSPATQYFLDQGLRVLLYFVAIGVGFYTAPVLIVAAQVMNFFPNFPEGMLRETFLLWLLGGSTWVWLGSIMLGAACFFTRAPERYWFMATPIIAPLLYALGVLAYFNFFYI